MKLNHVTILVSDFERSKAFYRSLGLTQIVEAAPRYARFTFPEGDATLSIEVKDGVVAGGPAELFFECDDVDATVGALQANGISFYQEPTDMFYLWREARLRDPDGHELRFYSDATGARLDPPWKLQHEAAPIPA
jgi:catechol 2,3-dioxygenase-like lactoylglutathione lyase family enzyme